LSWEQRAVIERLGGPVFLFLDNNFAGITGTLKAAEALCKHRDVFVVPYPDRLIEDDKAQPDSLTAEEVVTQVHNALSYSVWLQGMEERNGIR
jgi:hypothetical protein